MGRRTSNRGRFFGRRKPKPVVTDPVVAEPRPWIDAKKDRDSAWALIDRCIYSRLFESFRVSR
jgi:hypothetical protein